MGAIKRYIRAGRAVSLVTEFASKADIMNALIDFVALSHPESVDAATDEWTADELTRVIDEVRERQGVAKIRDWRRAAAKMEAAAAKRRGGAP